MSIDVTTIRDPGIRARGNRVWASFLLGAVVVSAIAMICGGVWAGKTVTDGIPHTEAAASTRTVGFVAGATGALLGWAGIWVGGIAARQLLIRHHHRNEGRED